MHELFTQASYCLEIAFLLVNSPDFVLPSVCQAILLHVSHKQNAALSHTHEYLLSFDPVKHLVVLQENTRLWSFSQQ